MILIARTIVIFVIIWQVFGMVLINDVMSWLINMVETYPGEVIALATLTTMVVLAEKASSALARHRLADTVDQEERDRNQEERDRKQEERDRNQEVHNGEMETLAKESLVVQYAILDNHK